MDIQICLVKCVAKNEPTCSEMGMERKNEKEDLMSGIGL